MPKHVEELYEDCLAMLLPEDGEALVTRESRLFEHIMDNCTITVPQECRFFVDVELGKMMEQVRLQRQRKYFQKTELRTRCREAFVCSGKHDYGHTAPNWENIFRLGLPGLRDRAAAYEAKTAPSYEKDFYAAVKRVYDAALRFTVRCADAAELAGKAEMAAGLRQLAVGRPRNLFEAMQLFFVYYALQQYGECTRLRSWGRMDSLLQPFYENDADALALARDLMFEMDRIQADANLPFALGGSDADGNDLICPMSYVLLEAYRTVPTSEVKLHLLVTERTPANFLRRAMDCIRQGHNSMVFLGDGTVIRALERLGEAPEDARRYTVIGCYECVGYEEVGCTGGSVVNIPKALELALNGGVDEATGWKLGVDWNEGTDLKGDFYAQLDHLVDTVVQLTNDAERLYPKVHGSPLFSGTLDAAMERGGDVYCDYAARYNNCSLCAIGLATTVDSLCAMERLMENGMTLPQIRELLHSDWAGQELLREQILHHYPRFGSGDPTVDALARELVTHLHEKLAACETVKNGVWRLSTLSIDWRVEWGRHTAATADGRHRGDPLSLNSGCTFGADRKGVTGHILSATAPDATMTPNSTIMDIDLHASAVSGEGGPDIMLATLMAYLRRGGYAVHYNVLDTETLKKAQADPEAYPNLQVRLCGWNVLFANLSESEKAEFIRRSEGASY